MFIRKTAKTDSRTGKKYFSYQLMESVRTERGPRQRLILNLGSNLPITDQDRKLLANRIEELRCGIQTLLPYPEPIEKLAQTYYRILLRKALDTVEPDTANDVPNQDKDLQTIDLNSLNHEQARSVGLEHLSLETIKKLELNTLLKDIGLSERQIEVALGVIIGKLCHPSSELSTRYWLQHISGVEELLDTNFTHLSKDLVYQAADNLLQNKEVIEKRLEQKERDLFSLNDTVVLYDLSNTYFEGTAKGVSNAARGKSKEKRSDCPLVTLGLVLNNQGFAKRSRMLPGNISEPGTLAEALKQLGTEEENRPIVVLDAGIATKENLEYLRENGYKYIVASRRRSCEIPSDIELEVIREKGSNLIKAGKVADTDIGEILLYCHSQDRMKKEEAICLLKKERLEQDLLTAAKALQKKGGTKSYNKVLERIGRIKEKNKAVARYYTIEVKHNEEKTLVTEITWGIDEESLKNKYQGAYLLRAYGLDWSSDELWSTYIMLTKVEDCFCCLKSDLGLRPIFHQSTRRVEGHIFLTVIAYHIMHAILYQLKLAGINIRWQMLRQHMQSQVRVTTTMRNEKGELIRIRSSTLAEPEQKEIYKALAISPRPGKTTKSIT